jgi:hydroxymethylglutaryl-CoA reductase
VIGAAAKAAKLCRTGFDSRVTGRHRRARAQILYADLPNTVQAYHLISSRATAVLGFLRDRLTGMDKYGGGLRAVRPKLLRLPHGAAILVVDLDIDTGEAMGANVVTKMAEAAAGHLTSMTGGAHPAAICSNRDAGIAVVAEAFWSSDEVPAETLRRAYKIHPDRASTHNKGIMNAVSAVALATAQDTRAIEAACHGQAADGRGYRPLSRFEMTDDGLRGTLELTLPVGTVGGATGHPVAALSRKIMGARDSEDLACLMASAGLAQNFGALRALAAEGIPESHRRLARRDG